MEDDHKERNFEFFQPCPPMAPSTRWLKSNASSLEKYFKLAIYSIKQKQIKALDILLLQVECES